MVDICIRDISDIDAGFLQAAYILGFKAGENGRLLAGDSTSDHPWVSKVQEVTQLKM